MTLYQKRLIALGVFFGVLLLAVASIVLFDVWIETHWGVEATISRAMRDLHPIALAAFMFVAGGTVAGLAAHFWAAQPPRGSTPGLPVDPVAADPVPKADAFRALFPAPREREREEAFAVGDPLVATYLRVALKDEGDLFLHFDWGMLHYNPANRGWYTVVDIADGQVSGEPYANPARAYAAVASTLNEAAEKEIDRDRAVPHRRPGDRPS
jgi:hypothetical protein